MCKEWETRWEREDIRNLQGKNRKKGGDRRGKVEKYDKAEVHGQKEKDEGEREDIVEGKGEKGKWKGRERSKEEKGCR